MDTIPFFNKLSTRLTLLILVVVVVLAGATVILVYRSETEQRNLIEAFVSNPIGSTDGEQVNILEVFESTLSNTLVNIAALFLFILVGATVFSRTLLIDPIASLVKATEELAKGNLGVTLPVTADSELGVLAQAFNQMSTNLAERNQELVSTNGALRISEDRYALAMQGANDGLWDYDVGSQSMYLSARWKTLLGYDDSDLDDTLESWLALVHPEDKELLRQSFDRHLAGETPNLQLEHRVQHKSGDYRWILARGTSLRDDQGQALRVAGSITDVTERVKALELLEQRVAERTSELVALLELSNSTALTLELYPLLERILDKLAEVMPFHVALISQAHADSFETLLSRGQPLVLDEQQLRQSLDAKQALAAGDQLYVPLIVRKKALGVMVLAGKDLAERSHLAFAFANQVAVALENAKLYEQVQEQAAYDERQHLARELHDSVSQALYSIVLGSHAARKQLEANPEKAIEPLEYVQNLAEAGLAEMRALIFELKPDVLEKEGLVSALRKQAEALEVRHKIKTSFEANGEPALSFPSKQALYRVVQEALHNVVKHAQAEQVSVKLCEQEDNVSIIIQDDGIGFQSDGSFPGHMGLKSMRERVEDLDGVFKLLSSAGGTEIQLEVPHHG